jgi:hypothetical protein
MGAMICELCGSSDIVKQDGLFVCQKCGTKYTLEEAKKLLGNVNTTEIAQKPAGQDSMSQELKNLYQVARRAKADNNGENAAKYYDMILVKDPNSWEAAFYVVYFKAMECKIAQIRSAAISVSNCEDSVLDLIKNHVAEDEQYEAVQEVMLRSQLIANMLAGGAKSHYDGIDSSIKDKYTQEYINNVCAARDILYTCGSQIDRIFEDKPEIAKLAADAWKGGITLHKTILPLLADQTGNKNTIASYVKQIGQYDPDYANDYTYKEKKQALDTEISALRKVVSDTENPKAVKSRGCMIFFIVLGLVPLVLGFVYMSDSSLAYLLLALGALSIIFGIIYYGIPKKSVQESIAQRNAEARENLRKKEEELAALERSHR